MAIHQYKTLRESGGSSQIKPSYVALYTKENLLRSAVGYRLGTGCDLRITMNVFIGYGLFAQGQVFLQGFRTFGYWINCLLC